MIGILTNTDKFSIFKIGDLQIKFKTSPFLQKYTSITKWNNGYIECMAKYSTLDTPIEEYIDLRYIAKRLRLPKDIEITDLSNITKTAVIQNDELVESVMSDEEDNIVMKYYNRNKDLLKESLNA